MKKLVISTSIIAIASLAPAAAADMVMAPTAPVVAPAVPVFTWSGGYAGVRAGGVWVDGEISDGGVTLSDDFDGGLVGGFIGYNWQFQNNVVFGVEGDLNYTWNENTYTIFGTDLDIGTDVSGSARVRLGYAMDRALLYATGGWAATRGYAEIPGDEESETFNGWTVGAGVDYAFTDKIFGRVEYRYTDYQNKDISGVDFDLNQNEVTAGIGVKF